MGKPTIRLWNAWGLGIIILHPSGVLYVNQAGGHTCLQQSAEGVYIPLFDELKGDEQENSLLKFFTSDKWWGSCSNGIDDETADFVDSILNESPVTSFLRVNRENLNASCEAWIYVQQKQKVGFKFSGFENMQAILTWANSD